MTYNCYNGAVETLDKIIDTVNAARPDYLTINEANKFDANDNHIMRQFAEKTGFSHYHLELCGDGNEYHVAALSKSPFVSITAIKPMSRAAILAVVDTKIGHTAFLSTHLSPFSELARLAEVAKVTNALKPYPNSVIMGDLNSLSSKDEYPEDFIEDFNSGQIRKFTTDGAVRFDVMRTLYKAGYIDIASLFELERENTVPTSVNQDAEHSTMRLDYILISQALKEKATSYQVIKDALTEVASDHYPVVVDIAI